MKRARSGSCLQYGNSGSNMFFLGHYTCIVIIQCSSSAHDPLILNTSGCVARAVRLDLRGEKALPREARARAQTRHRRTVI